MVVLLPNAVSNIEQLTLYQTVKVAGREQIHAENTSDVDFITATADWGTITHFGIFDAVTSGNLLFHGTLTESRTVNSGGQAKFLATELQIDLD